MDDKKKAFSGLVQVYYLLKMIGEKFSRVLR
jgi:hypothetical protein